MISVDGGAESQGRGVDPHDDEEAPAMFHVKHSLGDSDIPVSSQVPPALAHLSDAIDDLRRRDLLRERHAPLDPTSVSFCSNDYLGLASAPLTGHTPRGAGASRLLAGERAAHGDLERALSRWLRTDDTLLFSSGYAANLGTVAALAQPGDVIISDALNHASLIDGCRLSRAQVVVTPHLDLEAVARAIDEAGTRRVWVVVESYYGMDADSPDLLALRALCDRTGAALIVDEAHALGIFGPDGRGRCAEVGVVPDVLMGTLGKSFGHSGAFAAGCRTLTTWLWNRARSFVFSTGISPALAASAKRALDQSIAEPWRRRTVLSHANHLRESLDAMGLTVLGFGHILPIVIGDAAAAVAAASSLAAHGLHVHAVRPPTVPIGTSRLRLTVTARHTDAHIENAIRALSLVLATSLEEPNP
ncbi:aminotransferase class I/II-fold pyridoxal phosphate-dependent enzyme [Pendulispora albinea]|uniref:8-amino-7-oxononanoate synthase n=1 Tax=Pendulispora albinea TaxID=2741071 RepID=A0ABZ2LZY3_9BACT